MSQFFSLSQAITKPYALMDLDDTLFQTLRKIEAWQLPSHALTVATVNKHGEPLSFFTAKQVQFFNWLYHSTELIAVTARDTVEIGRVKLPFTSWQILTHGAVIHQPDGQILASWQSLMARQLVPLQALFAQVIERLQSQAQLTITPHVEDFLIDNQACQLRVYVAIKHQLKDHQALLELADSLPSLLGTVGEAFYVHVNANNLAILPHVVNKHHAVRFLLEQHLDSERACFGFGDSLADLGFLQLLDWYGTPKRGQLHEAILQGCEGCI